MGKAFRTSVHCQYLISETTESTGKYTHIRFISHCSVYFTLRITYSSFMMVVCVFNSIPDEITVLTKLERLDLANNDISG